MGSDTVASAQAAVAYATALTGINKNGYNFVYTIRDGSTNVSGPSAGLAFSLLAVSAIRHQNLYSNFTVTGTIDQYGNVGEVGGVYDKLQAAKSFGLKYAIVPKAATSDPEYLSYYITQQTFHLPIAQVSNVSQALNYINSTTVKPFTFNVTEDFNLNGLGAPITCTNCNITAFNTLTNFTFGYVQNETLHLPDNISAAQPNLLSNLNTFRSIAAKGYMYAGADLAFVQFSQEYPLAQANNLTLAAVGQAINSTSAYCSSLSPPQLTSKNYEYVIGGEARQGWALSSLADVRIVFNSTQTTDDLIDTYYLLARSVAWCHATSELYSIASTMGGNSVMFSQQGKANALSTLNKLKGVGGIYAQSAQLAYNNSEYGAVFYDAPYAAPTSTLGYSNAQLVALTQQNAANSTFGIWGSQFADSALFTLYQASHRVNDTSNLTSAYDTSLLALNISKSMQLVSNSFMPYNATVQIQQQNMQITTLESQLSSVYTMLEVLIIIVIILIILILYMVLLLHRVHQNTARRKRR